MEEKPSSSKESNTDSRFKKRFKNNQRGTGRHKGYSGNQKDGQGFADLRKKQAAREYLKFLQKERKGTGTAETDGTQKLPLKLFEILGRQGKKQSTVHTFSRAQKKADEKKKQKQEEKEKFLKEKEAKETAMKAYKAKKKERFLKLCKKTRKGQPVMKNQMEVLLEKIMKHKGIDTDKKPEG